MKLGFLTKPFRLKTPKFLLNRKQRFWQKAKELDRCYKEGGVIPLDEYNGDAPIKHLEKKRAVCIYDGKIRNGGLADRLRGIVSVYEICKEKNIDFKLIFTDPFELSKFLVPNKVNWKIEKKELNYNPTVTNICYIDTLTGSKYESNQQRKWFIREFNKKYKEFHIRTNATFAYDRDYATHFKELFKPSAKLQTSIDRQKEILGTGYISTSFRFMNLLGDFNETVDLQNKLTKEEQSELIAKNIEQIKNLHKRHPEKRIIANSDSTTFLQEAAKLDYVYTIPGNITHIDGKNTSSEYATYEKTFLDFFMIANAEKIYLLRTGQMYNSGYPFAASRIYNRPFERIDF